MWNISIYLPKKRNHSYPFYHMGHKQAKAWAECRDAVERLYHRDMWFLIEKTPDGSFQHCKRSTRASCAKKTCALFLYVHNEIEDIGFKPTKEKMFVFESNGNCLLISEPDKFYQAVEWMHAMVEIAHSRVTTHRTWIIGLAGVILGAILGVLGPRLFTFIQNILSNSQ